VEVVRIGTAEASNADAIIVAAFGDPGVRRLRAMLSIPVIGIGAAAMREAAAGGRRFGIATTTPRLVRSIEACVRGLGLDGMFTGVRVPGGDPLTLAADPAAQEAALAAAATACIEVDGADSVIIGGGPLSETAARLRRRFGIAIVEPVPAAIRWVLGRLAEPINSLSPT
jgi:Asp/Glu/hydantoin racemase